MVIKVRYVFRRYCGDPRIPGPSPARLFQALVACAGKWRSGRQSEMLRWLERQPPPTMSLAALGEVTSYITYGTAAVGGARSEGLDEAWRPWAGSGRGPDVVYAWQEDPPDEDAMRQLAEDVTVLGRGGDRVVVTYHRGYDVPLLASYGSSRPGQVWLPVEFGGPTATHGTGANRTFRVPYSGMLEHLDRQHEAKTRVIEQVNGVVRIRAVPMARWREQCYRRHAAIEGDHRRRKAAGLVTRQWTVFGLDKSQFAEDACRLCGALRHVAGDVLARKGWNKDLVAARVMGHDRDRSDDWLSYFALPSLSGPHPDGRVRRMMIAAPRSANPEWSELIDDLRTALPGTSLRGRHDGCYATLESGEIDGTVLAYVGEHRHWITATPVLVRGGSAGRTRTRNTQRVARRRLAALRSAAADFERSCGVPLSELRFTFDEAGPARPRADRFYCKSYQQNYLRAHVAASTPIAVHGPLTVGWGAHSGLGLLVADRSQNRSEPPSNQ